MTQVFLPIQPTPACSAKTRSWTGPASTHENASNPGPAIVGHPAHQRRKPALQNVVVVGAPGVPRDCRATRIPDARRVRLVGVVDRAPPRPPTAPSAGRAADRAARRASRRDMSCRPHDPRRSSSVNRASRGCRSAREMPQTSKPAACASDLTTDGVSDGKSRVGNVNCARECNRQCHRRLSIPRKLPGDVRQDSAVAECRELFGRVHAHYRRERQ